MTDKARSVNLYGKRVGTLYFRGTLTTFEFEEFYWNDPNRPVLGQQFEEDPRAQWRQSARAPVWFANLLPEKGPMLDLIARELDVNPRNEAAILAELGDDLPGALALGDPTDAPPDRSRSIVRTEVEGGDTKPSVRFSVAGVQLKLSMVERGNTLRLAGEGELGGYYVKFPGEYDGIPENEFTMLELARSCGISVPPTRLVEAAELGQLPRGFDRFRDRKCFVIERFDRGPTGRVQIEDFCQVIGQWPEKKYEGVSYQGLGKIVRRLCGESDFLEFIRRLAFNIVVGNEDAHLKNWSLWYPDHRSPRLSPCYDVVSTVMYPDLERGTGLRLGRYKSAQRISMESFQDLAQKAGASTSEVEDVVASVVRAYRTHRDQALATHLLSASKWGLLDDYQRSVPLLAQI